MKVKLLLLLALIPTFWALTRPGYFPMHDDIQGMRVLQMHKCVLDFQLPCRWVPDMGYGYGYPQFNYYAPLPYYFMEGFVIAGNPILDTVKVGFAASLILSAYSMYLLASYVWGKKGGFISAIFYSYAPYRAVDIYVRGAMGEAWAFVFLPLVLLFSLRILDGKKAVLPFALSVAGLLLSHNISIVMFAPFCVLFVFTLRRFNIDSLKRLSVGAFWGLSLSAFFVFPAFLEKNLVHVDTILAGYFNFLAHFVGIRQLLFSTHWGYGSSSLGPLDGMSLSVGLWHWAVPALSLLVLLLLKKYSELRLALIFVIFGGLALLLIHPRSQIIWNNLDILSFVQFPWRFLMVAVLFFSLAAGSVGVLLARYSKLIILSLLFLLILFNASYFFPKAYVDIDDRARFSGNNWMLQQTISIFDYLPKSAKFPPSSEAPDKPFATEGEVTIVDGLKGTNWQRWNVIVHSGESEIAFPLYNFPTWEAKIDGKKAEVFESGDLGLVTLEVSNGVHEVSLVLRDTLVRTSANVATILALLAIPVVLYNNKKKLW